MMVRWSPLLFAGIFALLLVACGGDEKTLDACLDVICPRGVCDTVSGECVEAERCASDGECFSGRRCIEGSCRPPCDPATESCEALPECRVETESVDCPEEHRCVDGVCTPEEQPTIPESCLNGWDCPDELVCRFEQCVESQACIPDEYEPNDTEALATVIDALPATLRATLCREDIDVFSIDLGILNLVEGTFVVDLQLEAEDIGNGQFLAEIYGPNGEFLAEELADDGGRVFFTTPRSAEDIGLHLIIVRDVLTRKSAGVRYRLVTEFVGAEVIFCTPGESTCADEDRARVCLDSGTEHELLDCALGCDPDRGRCRVALGDSCATPIDASQGFRGELRWSDWSNDLQLSDEGTCGNSDDTSGLSLDMRTGGSEVVFYLEIPDGHGFTARMETPLDHGGLYLVEDCADADGTCKGGSFAGERLLRGAFKNELGWSNESGATVSLYLIAESGSPQSGSQSASKAFIDIVTGPLTCAPGALQCLGGDLARCDGGGVELVLDRPCANGCLVAGEGDEGDRCLEPLNQTCKGAIDLVARGGTFTGFIDDYSADYDPLAGGCTGSSAPGRDAAFFIDADAGDVISATLLSDFKAHLWVTTDCTRAAQACVAGVHSGEASREILQFAAPSTGRYYIIVDADDMEQVGRFQLDAQVDLAMCGAGTALGCLNETSLSYCGPFGAPLPYHCEGGCQAGSCAIAAGDICPDAISVRDGDVVSGLFRGVNSLRLGEDVAGRCDLRDAALQYGDGPTGPDRFYAVEMTAGQTLHVTGYDSSGVGAFFILEDCREGSSCIELEHSRRQVDLTYLAAEDRTVYVVAGSFEARSSLESYYLEFHILDALCEAGERACIDADTAAYCLPQGYWETIDCIAGCTLDGRCDVPRGDTCGDAIPLEHLSRIRGTLNNTKALETGKGLRGACDFGWDTNDLPGEGDTFYVVDLEAGQRLEVEVSADVDTRVYFLGSCPQMGTCKSYSSWSRNHRLSYVAPSEESVYIVVENRLPFSLFSSPGFDLRVTIQSPGCTAGVATCLEDGETLGVCNTDGYFDTYACGSLCIEGRCEQPTGLVCQDAIMLAPGALTSASFGNPPTLTHDETTVGDCDFSDLAEGQLKGSTTIYGVEVEAGQIMHARADSTSTRMFLYAFDDCAQGSDSCLSRSGQGGEQELFVEAAQTGTIYLAVTRAGQETSNVNYDLTVFTYWPGCEPGQAQCLDDGNSVLFCGAEGEATPYRCEGGCEDGACLTPRGDVCMDAVEVVPGTTVSGNFMSMNSLNPGAGEVGLCSFGTESLNGRDTIYRVLVPGGSVLSATLTTTVESTRIYFLEDCMDTSSCLVNTNQFDEVARYFVTEEEWVYVVVDALGSLRSPETFELTIEVENPDCQPGEKRCGTEVGALETCTPFGVFETHICSSLVCSNGACDEPDGESCKEPEILVNGDIVTDDFGVLNTVEISRGIAGQCDVTQLTRGPERVYAVDLLAGQNLAARLDAPDSNTLFYIMTDCDAADTCLDYGRSGTGELILYHLAMQDERVYLIVDHRFTGGSSEPFALAVSVGFPECDPDGLRCSADGDLERCNRAGLWLPHTTCISGCADGACLEPQGDICGDAIPLVAGQSVTGDISVGTKTLNRPGGRVGQCDYFAAQTGVDHIYSLEVPAGHVARARLNTNDPELVVSMWESCFVADSCVASGSLASAHLEIFYEATLETTLSVIVDGAALSTGTYQLFVDVELPSCVDGARRCDGLDAEVCNGFGVWESIPCDGAGCNQGFCANPGGDVCADAISAASGEVYVGDWSGSNNLSSQIAAQTGATGSCSLSNQAALGPDTFYAVELLGGDVLRGELTTALIDGHIYLVRDCANLDTCLTQSPNSGSKTLYYEASQQETVFIVVDKLGSDPSSETYTLRVDVQPRGACTQGAATCADENELSYCSPRGILEPYPCEGGCDEGRCIAPRGDICADAVAMATGDSFLDVFVGALEARLNPGAGTCYLSTENSMPGVERVFAIDLDAGDILEASLSGAASQIGLTGMYILDSCGADAVDACVYGVNRVADLEFFAAWSGTYYLVVDATSETARPTVDLSVSIRKANALCQPSGSTCDPATGELTRCSDDGAEVTHMVACPDGCLMDYCAPSPVLNDRCEDAVLIEGPMRLADHFERFTNQYNPGNASCVGMTTPGLDAVYRVVLDAGEALSARVQADAGNQQPALYLLSACEDLASTCLAGAYSGTYVTSLEFVSPEPGEYFLVVDSRRGSHRAHFILDVDFGYAECVPGATSCIDESLAEVCDGLGTWSTLTCPYGCDADTDACWPPPNNVCTGAVDATAGLGLTLSIEDFRGDYSPDDAPGVSCTGSAARGPDMVFYVEVERNEVISARMSGQSFEGTIWITSECGQADACLAGGSGELAFTAPEAGRYFIMVDSELGPDGQAPRGEFQLQIEVLSPVCAVTDVVCLDEATLSYCASDGSALLTYTCEGGCFEGQCASPMGDVCADAIEATGGGMFFGNFSTLSNAVDPGFGGCTGFDAPGADGIYRVNLAAGESLTAVLSNLGAANDLSLYVVEDCSAARSTCVAGSDQAGTVTETVAYTASSPMTLYVIADTWNADATGEYQLLIEIQ